MLGVEHHEDGALLVHRQRDLLVAFMRGIQYHGATSFSESDHILIHDAGVQAEIFILAPYAGFDQFKRCGFVLFTPKRPSDNAEQ